MKIKNKKMNFKIMNHLRNTRKLFKKKKFLMLISKLINKPNQQNSYQKYILIKKKIKTLLKKRLKIINQNEIFIQH